MITRSAFFFLIGLSFLVNTVKGQLLQFSKVEGLSQNTVYSITKDSHGFLWAATADGLNRYDGVKMKVFKPSVDESIGTYSNRFIRSKLLEDKNGQLWFSSGAGLYTYSKRKDLFEPRKVVAKNQKIPTGLDPLLVSGSHFWGVNGLYGVCEFNTEKNSWSGYPVHDSVHSEIIIKNAITDENNNFWFLAQDGVLFFDIVKKTWTSFFKGKKFISIGAGPGVVFFVTEKQVYFSSLEHLELKKIVTESPTTEITIRKFFTDKKSNVWAGDDFGNIYCKEKQSDKFHLRGNINGDNSSGSLYPVYSLFVDDNDILWVGADVLGLLKTSVSKPTFNLFPRITHGKENSLFIHCIYEEQENILLGTFRKGLLKVSKQTGKSEAINLPFDKEVEPDNHSVSAIHKDTDGNLWVAAYTSLFVRKKNTDVFDRMDLPKPQDVNDHYMKPFAIKVYKDTLFMSSEWGIHKIYKSGEKYVSPYRDFLRMGFFYDIYIDKEKNFWLAYEGGIIRGKNLNTSLGVNPGDTLLLKNVGVKSFLEDTALNMLWVSTTSGLVAMHLPTGKYKNFTEADGLGNSYVYGAVKDGDILWLSTNKGLSRAVITVKPGDVIPALSFVNFTKQDGLPDDEFNTGAFHHGESGDFYFGSIKGVVWFKPEEIKLNQYLPTLVMTDLRINEEKADSSLSAEYITDLSLPYYKNNLFFSFRGIEYTNAANVQYAYILEGWDRDWIYSGTLNEVRYNSLPHGKYTFKVKAANGSGIWNENVYSVSVIIHPPFWKTGWFYTLAAITLLLMIILITRYFAQQKLKQKVLELERQKEIDKERQRISREMHDDIGAGLTQITLMSESAKAKLSTHELDNIAQTSRQLVSNMSEIIWSLNPENKTLEQLLAYLREQLNKQLEYSGIDYSIELPEKGDSIFLSNEQRRNILMVTKEIINNIIKYSKARNIQIKATLNDHRLIFAVQDDGKGFDLEAKYAGNGLRNIRHRIGELKGILEIESAPGKGSRFVYEIPLQPTT